MNEPYTFLPSEEVRLLARMAEEASEFHRNEAPTLPGWFKLSRNRVATLFYNAEERRMVLAYKGSSTPEDRSTDFNIFHGREFRGDHPSTIEMVDPMFREGERILIETIREMPDTPLSLTGHSLGGSIAELLALKYPQWNLETDLFNPGMGKNVSYRRMKASMQRQLPPMNLRRHLVLNDPASLTSGNGMGRTLFYRPMEGYDEHDIRQFSWRGTAF
jgi:pimeloyl-ACP methyl ester carboxylesterase